VRFTHIPLSTPSSYLPFNLFQNPHHQPPTNDSAIVLDRSHHIEPPPYTVHHTTQHRTMSLPTTAITTASRFYTCTAGWPSGVWCDHHHPGDQPTTASTQALNNAMQVLQFSLLTFVVLRLLARFASIGALVGLCPIAGGFLYDVGVGLPVVDAAPATTTTSLIASSTKTSGLESAGAGAGSGHLRFTLWIFSAALTVLVLALVTGYFRRGMPGLSRLTTYRPLTGRLSTGSEPESVRDAVNSNTASNEKNARTPHIRTNLPTTIAVLLLIAILIPIAFAVDSTPEVTKVARSAAQEGGDISPIWITYYSTTTTWLPAVTVTAPPVLGSSLTPVMSTEGVAETDWSKGFTSVCTEIEQAVCPIVEGRKTVMPPRVIAAA
jgi:hypothetical protein